MKTSVFYNETQKLKFLEDSNFYEGYGLSPDHDDRIKSLSENFKKIQKESKQSFVVDWQIPEKL